MEMCAVSKPHRGGMQVLPRKENAICVPIMEGAASVPKIAGVACSILG